MFTIRKATVADCELIHTMAKEVFPATYKDILSPEQLDYMMDWMYAPSNVRKQMEEDHYLSAPGQTPGGFIVTDNQASFEKCPYPACADRHSCQKICDLMNRIIEES